MRLSRLPLFQVAVALLLFVSPSVSQTIVASTDPGSNDDRRAIVAQLLKEADEFKLAVSSGNLTDAGISHAALSHLLVKLRPSAAQRLSDAEQQTERQNLSHVYQLPKLAKLALEADDLEKAAAYVSEMRAALAGPNTVGPYDGNLIHDSNMVDGVLALRRGNIESAKTLLLAAGKTTGSPVLNTFGPNMTLAKELAEKGEIATVLAYLNDCQSFWKGNTETLARWIATLKGGAVPDFRPNLSL